MLPTGHFSAPQTVQFIAIFIILTSIGSGQPPVESEWPFWSLLANFAIYCMYPFFRLEKLLWSINVMITPAVLQGTKEMCCRCRKEINLGRLSLFYFNNIFLLLLLLRKIELYFKDNYCAVYDDILT